MISGRSSDLKVYLSIFLSYLHQAVDLGDLEDKVRSVTFYNLVENPEDVFSGTLYDLGGNAVDKETSVGIGEVHSVVDAEPLIILEDPGQDQQQSFLIRNWKYAAALTGLGITGISAYLYFNKNTSLPTMNFYSLWESIKQRLGMSQE